MAINPDEKEKRVLKWSSVESGLKGGGEMEYCCF